MTHAAVEPERYIDRRELAAIMGVSLATIDRLVRAGMPSEMWGMRARRFLPSEAIAWARTNGTTPRGTVVRLDDRRRRVH